MIITISKKFLLSFLFLFPLYIFAQRDTIYFDYNWSICQKPLASYYRVCAISRGKYVFYAGPFEDYYVNGKLEMAGSYSDKGLKEGGFTAYYPNGNKKYEGDYKSDMPNGLWSFFSEDGKLKLQLKCANSRDFTPLFLVDKNGDTTVKNGNGNFVLSKNDFIDLFTPQSSCSMEGTVVDGVKDGTIYYYDCSNHRKVDYLEVYKKGNFKSSSSGVSQIADIPFGSMELSFDKQEKVDRFYHANPLFGENEAGDRLALDFIVNNNFYGIASTAKTFDDNYKDFYTVIAYVLNGSLNEYNKHSQPLTWLADNDRDVFNRLVVYQPNSFAPRLINGSITITIDTSGYVSNSVFKGNFEISEIDKINYYLSTFYNLQPFIENGEKVNRDINLKVYYNIDSTTENDSLKSYQYLYVLENADKQNIEPLPIIPQIAPAFPGGQAAWVKYLQRNLHPDVPSEHKAPDGTYVVTVSFHVDEKGYISQVKALNDPGYGATQEAVRVVQSSPAWVPGVLNGRNISCSQRISITFVVKNY